MDCPSCGASIELDLKKKSVVVKSVSEISFDEFEKVLKTSGYEAKL